MGQVEDEGPFRPGLMLQCLRRAGFVNVRVQGASFSHPRFYTVFAKVVNRMTKPLLNLGPFRYFAWCAVYAAEKPQAPGARAPDAPPTHS